jgi:PAS domain S-box-containing protein
VLEIGSADLATRILWHRVRSIPLAFLPAMCTVITLEVTRHLKWLTPIRSVLLLVIPVGAICAVFLGGGTRLVHFGFHLDPSVAGPFLLYGKGVVAYAFVAYTYLLFTADIALLVVSVTGSAAIYRRQARVLALGLLIPLVAGLITLLVPQGRLWGDPTSGAVTLTGILVAAVFFRYRSLELIPIVNTVLFQAIEDASLIFDIKGRLVGCNDRARRVLGLEQRGTVGSSIAQLPPPWSSVLAPFADTVSCREEVTAVLADEERAFDLTISPLSYAGGSALGRLLVLHDITEQRRAKEELRFNRERLQLALDSANEGMWDTRRPWDVSYWSPRFYTMLGYAPDELPAGRASWEKLLHPDDWETGTSGIAAVLADGGTRREIEYRMRTKSGEWRWILSRSTVVERDEAGAAVRIVGTHQDITARKEVEAKLRGFIEQATEAITLVDEDGKIVEFNSSASAMTGYAQEAVLGTTVWSFQALLLPKEEWRPDTERNLETMFREALATGAASFLNRPMSGRLRRADGRHIDFEQFTFAIRTNRGYQVGSIEHDVTATRRTEEALRHSEEQLRQAQKMEAIGRLAGGVAHDFNNILTIIGGYSAMLRDDQPEGSPTRENAEAIIKAAGRASTLTRQLLAFSRKQVMEPRIISPVDLLRNVEAMLARVIGEDVELSIVTHPDTGAIRADPGQVEQVLMNLAVNARDAMPGGGLLSIATSNRILGPDYVATHPMVKPGEYVQVVVADTGQGMDSETLARIFEPFFTTKPPGKGTGLGLSMAYGIVKQSGGHIFCESRVGRGTVFTIFFPRVFEQPESLAVAARGSEPQRGNGTVLLVEDEAGVRGFVQSVLAKNGYDVVVAADGNEALDAFSLRHNSVDILLTDVIMPRMSGTELAGRLRSARPAIKVLYMSGYTEEGIARDGELDPSVAFLRKPFTPRELLEKIRSMTGQSPRG